MGAPEAQPGAASIYVERFRFLRAIFAPSLPNAVLTDFGRCAIVRFFFAAAAAFLMFLRAALRCLVLDMASPVPPSRCHPRNNGWRYACVAAARPTEACARHESGVNAKASFTACRIISSDASHPRYSPKAR